MDGFKALKPEDIGGNVFEKIGKDWMLLAAEKDGAVNMMTASWGGLGVLWAKPVAFTFFRPQRYTYEFVTAAKTLSATFYDEGFRDKLNLCGTKSGRDIDKIKECGFTVLYSDDASGGAIASEGRTPYFAESSLALILKKLYVQRLEPGCFVAEGLDSLHYPKKDYHYMVISEITGVLQKQ